MIKEKIKNFFKENQFLNAIKNNIGNSIFSLSNLLTITIDAFVLNIILVRFLSVADLGDYKLVFSVINIIIIFTLNGLNMSISKAAAKRYKVFFIRGTRIRVLSSFIAGLILIILSFTLYKNSNIKFALIYSSLIIPVYFGLNTWEAFLMGKRDFKGIFIYYLFLIGTRLALCGAIIYFFRNFLYAVLVFLIVSGIYNAIYFIRIFKKTKWEEIDRDREKELTGHGFRLTGASVVSVIATNIERIILGAISTSVMVGIYSIAHIIPTFIKNSMKTVISVPTMKLASYKEKENRRILKKYLFIIFMSGLVIFGSFWFITPILLRVFFKIEDLEIIRYGRLMLLPLIFMPVDLTIKYMCKYQGSGSSFFKLNTTTDIMKLAFLAILIPFFKIYGIIIALTLTEFFTFIILIIWFMRSNRKFGVK